MVRTATHFFEGFPILTYEPHFPSFPVCSIEIYSSTKTFRPIRSPIRDLSTFIINVDKNSACSYQFASISSIPSIDAYIFNYHYAPRWSDVETTLGLAERFSIRIKIVCSTNPHAFCTHTDAESRHPKLLFKTCSGACHVQRNVMDTLCRFLAALGRAVPNDF